MYCNLSYLHNIQVCEFETHRVMAYGLSLVALVVCCFRTDISLNILCQWYKVLIAQNK